MDKILTSVPLATKPYKNGDLVQCNFCPTLYTRGNWSTGRYQSTSGNFKLSMRISDDVCPCCHTHEDRR